MWYRRPRSAFRTVTVMKLDAWSALDKVNTRDVSWSCPSVANPRPRGTKNPFRNTGLGIQRSSALTSHLDLDSCLQRWNLSFRMEMWPQLELVYMGSVKISLMPPRRYASQNWTPPSCLLCRKKMFLPLNGVTVARSGLGGLGFPVMRSSELFKRCMAEHAEGRTIMSSVHDEWQHAN